MKNLTKLLLLCSYLFLNNANAQWTTNLNVNTQTTTIRGSSVGMSASRKDGKTYITYYRPSGGKYYLHLQLLDQNGNRMWGNDGVLVVNKSPGTGIYDYDLKVDTAGNAIVGAHFENVYDSIFVAKFDQMGTPLWGVNGFFIGEGGSPLLAITPNNNIIVGNRFNGNLWKLDPLTGAPMFAITLPSSFLHAIVPTSTEDFIVSYVLQSGSGFGYGYFNAMKYNATGSTVWTAPTVMSSISSFNVDRSYDLSDGLDGMYSQITVIVGFTNKQSYIQHVNSAGAVTFGINGTQLSTDTVKVYSKGLVFDKPQQMLYALASIENYHTERGVKFQKINTAGAVQFIPQALTTEPLTNNPAIINLGMETFGGLIKTNNGYFYTYIDTFYRIQSDLIDSNGNMAMQHPICTLASAKENKFSLSYAEYLSPGFKNFQTVVVWEDERDSTSGVYAQNLRDQTPFSLCVVTSTTTASVCANAYPYTGFGHTMTTAGRDTLHLYSVAGCDSMAILVLTEKAVTSSIKTISVCSSAMPYTGFGHTMSAAGNDTIHLLNSQGCDSAAILVLTVKQTSTSTKTVSICPSALPYSGFGHTIATAKADTIHLMNGAGCDSAAILILTLKSPSISTTPVSICSNNLPYSGYGHTMAAAGKDTLHLTNSVGCDSVAILVLTVKQTSSYIYSDTICFGATYSFGTSTLTNTGTYTKKVQNAVGCDSNITLHLFVRPAVVLAISKSGSVLTATAGLTAYQWYLNGTLITGATGQVYHATQNGNYTVKASLSGCNQTSAAMTLSNVGIGNINNDIELKLYPNPTNAVLNLETSEKVLSVIVYDLVGNKVKTFGRDAKQINIQELAPATYMVIISTENGTVQRKVIKE